MIEVKKCYIDCEYINDYWKDNLIVDQSKHNNCSNNQTHDKPNNDLKRLTIDVNSYNEFQKFIDNIEESNDIYTDTNIYNNTNLHNNLNNKIYNNLNNDKDYDNEDYDNENMKEKLNNNYKAKIGMNPNVFRKKHVDNIRNSISDKSNNTRTNTICYHGEGFGRKQNSDNRMYDIQKSGEHNIFPKHSNSNKDKGKMFSLPKKCRIYEYESRERKILLDSFSKPKLIS
jgi:hypothetical protein